MRRYRHPLRICFERSGVALAIVASLAAPTANAALGGAYASVEADRAHMAARASSSVVATHSVHALTLANGAVTREFVRPDGKVFAVAWRGPSRPDLKQVLGDYFDVMQADNVRPGHVRSRRPMVVRRADVVIQNEGHPGAFWGLAYLPAEAPAGFTADDLR